LRLLNFDFLAPIGPGITQVGDLDDWTFVVEQDGWTLTVSRESGKMLVDGVARGNVEKSLQTVRDLMTWQEIDRGNTNNTIRIIKRAFYVYDHMNHDPSFEECDCKEKEVQREQEAKLLEEKERREKQRLVSKVLIDGLYDDNDDSDDSDCHLPKLRGCQHLMKKIWKMVTSADADLDSNPLLLPEHEGQPTLLAFLPAQMSPRDRRYTQGWLAGIRARDNDVATSQGQSPARMIAMHRDDIPFNFLVAGVTYCQFPTLQNLYGLYNVDQEGQTLVCLRILNGVITQRRQRQLPASPQ